MWGGLKLPEKSSSANMPVIKSCPKLELCSKASEFPKGTGNKLEDGLGLMQELARGSQYTYKPEITPTNCLPLARVVRVTETAGSPAWPRAGLRLGTRSAGRGNSDQSTPSAFWREGSLSSPLHEQEGDDGI